MIEVIVTMVIMSIIMGVTSQLFLTASKGYTASATRGELHTELSSALQRIVSELRAARPKPSTTPAVADITATTASSIIWMDADGSSREVSISGTNLLYSVAGGTGIVLASSVSSLAIDTFDESDAALAASLSGTGTQSIRRVRITLVGTHSGVTETLRTRVFPRACLATVGS
jgi:Tfp pilus assembly protein PilW